MNKISDVDKAVLSYYNIPYIIEAYKIFYGEYPTFFEENIQLEKELMEYMMTILIEYNIYNCEIKSKYNYIYLDSPKFKIDLLFTRFKDLKNKENDLEQLCSCSINDLEKKGIMSISYIIKDQIKNIEDSINYLKMLHNILIYRTYAITLVSNHKSFSDKLFKMIEKIEEKYKELEYTSDKIYEVIKFISFKLKLFPEKSNLNIDIDLVINQAKEMEIDFDSYIGILNNNKIKKYEK